MLATSILFFVISGIQFWASDYMRLVLKIPEEIVFPAFSIITLTGPTFGCIIGGGLTHMFGGYNHPNAIKLILYAGTVGMVVSLPIPFVDHTPTFLVLFWLSLFFGGFIMPGMTGVMINSAPKKHKALANSIAYVSYNLLGYVPGPLVYGVITYFKGPESKVGMFVLIYSLVLCILLVWFAYRNSPRNKVEVTDILQNVKEFEESESEYNQEEQKKVAREKNRVLRYSMGNGDWSVRNSNPFKKKTLLEDLIGPNTGFPTPVNLDQSINQPRGQSWRKSSLVGKPMNKRVSLVQNRESLNKGDTTMRQRHKRGLSLFDNDNIMSIGLGGQPASNLFQINHPSFTSKPNRRAKSIFH
jgi:hypothetical protein